MLVAHNPDTAGIGRVALAAAHLGHGDPEKALRVLDTAIAHLEQTAAFDFVDHESLGLARAFQALAYEANGELQRAGKTAASLATELAPDLLPGVIVREVSIRSRTSLSASRRRPRRSACFRFE